MILLSQTLFDEVIHDLMQCHRILFFKLLPDYTTLSNDREQGPDPYFGMVRNRNGYGCSFALTLHDNMTSAPPDFGKTVPLQNTADFPP